MENSRRLIIKSVEIADHYAVISDMMRGLHISERELFDKTTSWDEIEENYMKYVAETKDENDGTLLIAYLGDEPAGFIFGYFEEEDDSRIEEYTGKELYISDGFVYPAYRRMGIYKELNNTLEELYINKGVRRILRFTLVSNTRMQQFLKTEGYQPVRLLYEKWLEPDGKTVKQLGFHSPE